MVLEAESLSHTLQEVDIEQMLSSVEYLLAPNHEAFLGDAFTTLVDISGVQAKQWSRHYKAIAIATLETATGEHATPTDVWMQESWLLAASPDGLIGEFTVSEGGTRPQLPPLVRYQNQASGSATHVVQDMPNLSMLFSPSELKFTLVFLEFAGPHAGSSSTRTENDPNIIPASREMFYDGDVIEIVSSQDDAASEEVEVIQSHPVAASSPVQMERNEEVVPV
ncbi:hypothetical protein FQR65_LT19198 [Abscondita terminalis]|nr:hypothetical protein FQR65_LT19198 [Abscondita terminalis]